MSSRDGFSSPPFMELLGGEDKGEAFPGSLLYTRVSFLVLCLLETYRQVSSSLFEYSSSLDGSWTATLIGSHI